MRAPRNYFGRSMQRDAGMLSRVADSLYWMSRYLERAEQTARLLDVEMQLWLDQSPEAGLGRWKFLLEALRMPAAQGPVDPTRLINMLVFSRTNASSIVSCIATARENLRHVREQCSSEMWGQLNRLYLEVIETWPEEAWMLKSHAFFQTVQEGAHLFQGITDGTMSHGEGWQFIQLGRYVERTDALAALLETHFKRVAHPADQAVESGEYLGWAGLLQGLYGGDTSLAGGGIFVAESGFSTFGAIFGGSGECGAAHYWGVDRAAGKIADADCRADAGAAELQPD